MTERGVFALSRGWFDHPIFSTEPYTEREAWAWLISEAAWKNRTRRVGSFVVDLKRGQLCASVRHLEKKWQWTPGRVERFLKRLKTATMIATDARHGITIITICNYNIYQRVSLPDATDIATQNTTAARQQRDNTEDIKNIESDDDEDSRESPRNLGASEIADKIIEVCGLDREFVPPAWCGAVMTVQKWLTQGWPKEIILVSVQEQMARRKGIGPPNKITYFEKGIAEAIARQNRPLPTVNVIEGETVNVTGKAQNTGVIAAADRLLERMRSFGPNPDSPGTRSGAGEAPVRMLPKG